MTKSAWFVLICPVLTSTLACGGADSRTSASATGLTIGSNSGSSASAEGPETGDSDDADAGTTDEASSDSSDGGLKLDTINMEEGQASADDGGNPAAGCEAIDFLFVIDNSGSMGDNQQNLINSFPGFIDKIQATIADVDSYHIMVVKTDEYWNDCQVECLFFPGMCQFGGWNACDGAPSVCDETLGAGVNFPIGDGASNMPCNLTGGQRYITPLEPLNLLPQKFTCIASVGTDGDSSEKPMASLTAAVGPGEANGCNAGFLRDDAVLVITIITDEEDGDSPGTPAGWYQNIIAQKVGDGSGVVVLGLINDVGNPNVPNPTCPLESQVPTKIRSFMQMFPNHIEGSVCALDYAPFFDQAVNLIDTACDEYTPVG